MTIDRFADDEHSETAKELADAVTDRDREMENGMKMTKIKNTHGGPGRGQGRHLESLHMRMGNDLHMSIGDVAYVIKIERIEYSPRSKRTRRIAYGVTRDGLPVKIGH